MCADVVERAIVLVVTVPLDRTECDLSISGIYSVRYPTIQSLCDSRKMDYLDVYTREGEMSSIYMPILYGS